MCGQSNQKDVRAESWGIVELCVAEIGCIVLTQNGWIALYKVPWYMGR